MGSLTYQRAWARFQTALEQRLETSETPASQRAVYQDAVDRLVRIAIDEEELDRVARELAVDPDTIPFPTRSKPTGWDSSISTSQPTTATTTRKSEP